MDNPFDQNQVYERFLYDYFIGKGFYETAEVFRRETEARGYPLSPSEIDVPNELLLEWWVVNSDFSEWERKNLLDKEGSSYKAEGSIWQQSGLTLSREYALSQEMIEELTLDNSFGVVFGKNLLPETVSNLGSMIQFSGPKNQDYTDNQGLESVVQDFPRTTLIASNEVGLAVPNPGISLPSFPLVNQGGTESQSAGKRKRSRDYEDESIDIPGTNISHLETSWRSIDSDYPFEFPPSLIKIAEDWMRAFGQDDFFNFPTYPFEEKNDEEGNFCSKGITFKLSSSLVEEKQEDTSVIKDDTFELSSLVKVNPGVESTGSGR